MPNLLQLQDETTSHEWDEFVKLHPQGTFFHLSKWQQVISTCFKHPCFYLYLKRQGQIRAVLPLVQVKSKLFGHGLVSTPFCVYGGALFTHQDDFEELHAQAIKIQTQTGADFVEYRTIEKNTNNLPTKDALYVTFIKKIHSKTEDNLLSIPRKQRAVIRHALSNLDLSFSSLSLNEFFKIYSQSVRDHGTPIFHKSYFLELLTQFKKDISIMGVRDQSGRAISAVMNFHFQKTILPYYGGGLPVARKLGAFDLMYWNTLEQARENGFEFFDFGRSKVGTGSFNYKKNWGLSPISLNYQYNLTVGQAIPQINPLNPKYRLFIALWKRLPLPIANQLGPFLIPYLG